MKYLLVLSLLCISYQNVCTYNILAFLPAASKSHYYIGHNLMKGLANEGNQVTVISPFKEEKPIENYTQIILENAWEESRKNFAKDNFADFNHMHSWDVVLKFFGLADNTSKRISSKICLADYSIGFGRYFNAPVVGISAFGASKWTTDLVGTPNFASYVPHTYNHYTDRMNFWQRAYNSLTYWFEDIVMPYYYISKQQKIMEQLFPEAKNWPSLDEIRKNVSLVLLNTHTTIGTPRPYTPNMIEVGGMQIRKEVTPLSPEVQTFLDGAKDGAIFVSLGSNVLITKLPEHQFNAIVNSFDSYPNIRILIKSDDHIVIPSHKKSDVLIEPWFNQQSILAHKNIKLFITHGGILSITEAVHFGKPLVGIPFFFDQHLNMHLAEQKGFAINVPIEILTSERIATAVYKVLEQPSYTEQAKIISDRYHDQPLSPLETAMHWVKHVAKNKGAPHLKSVAVELPFYKLYNLDVWALIFGIIAGFIYILAKFISSLVSVIFRVNSTQKVKKFK